MTYDVIIIGAGASGLFSGICLENKLKKLILEKTGKPGAKVLLSGGERANVTNMNIETDNSYFSQNKKFLKSIFSKYNQWDFMGFCRENGIELVEEDNGRMILSSGNSTEILNLLLKKTRENNCEIKLNSEVIEIKALSSNYESPCFEIKLINNKKYRTKNIIISSGGKSFFQVGTSGDGYNFAKNFGINIIPTFPGLCGITTKKDLSTLSGVSCKTEISLIDKTSKNKKSRIIHSEKGPMLFTHFGLSGPIVFNLSVALGKYLGTLDNKIDFEKYLRNNLVVKIEFDLNNIAKKIINFFDLNSGNSEKIILELHSLRGRKEAKITTGGVNLDELDNNMQSKKHKGLFFTGEIVDVTGKTGGFNLQWAWSSAFAVGKFLNEEKNKK